MSSPTPDKAQVNQSQHRDECFDAFGKIAVLYGGTSQEREVSLRSGRAVINALSNAGAQVIEIDVGEQPLTQIQALEADIAFICLHGAAGEDGRIQSALSLAGIPYTGSGHTACALSMNKLLTKQVWQSLGLRTPSYRILDQDCDFEAVHQALDGDCFVKPVCEGSSIGMRRTRSANELAEAYTFARKFDSTVIAEQTITGREFSVTLLNDEVLPEVELSHAGDFYDYDAKYKAKTTCYSCPSDIHSGHRAALHSVAKQAFSAVGAANWGRVDFIFDGNTFWLLELNTVPGMTTSSLVPKAAEAAGFDFTQLLYQILRGAKGRAHAQSATKVSAISKAENGGKDTAGSNYVS